jgi:hypothetical protein
MPFTLAHPAAILPLRGVRYLRTAPLVIGALIPDLPYYLPRGTGRTLPTHTFVGSFTADLVLGYALLAVIFLLRQPLTALLSGRARWLCLAALAPLRRRPLEWLFAAPAIVVGVWTHLLWDSFTHSNGWMVHRVDALSVPVTIAGVTSPVYHVLQYVSSVFGLAVMVVWYWRRPVPPAIPADPLAPRSSVGPVLMLVAAAAILIGAVQATESFGRFHNIYGMLNLLLTHSLAWFAALYLLGGIIVALEHSHEQASG